MARRLVQLYVGLALYGLGLALQLSSHLGNDPWDVLHEGLALRFGLTIGVWILIAGALVLLAWIPLRLRPGIGTVSNVFLVGAFTDLFLWLLPDPDALAARAAYLVAAVLVGGFATGCYIGAGLGPGPRDGLMTGIAARGRSIRAVRTGIELTVLAAGWLLGGTVGIGTVLYALAIGPLTHVFLPMLTIGDPAKGTDVEDEREASAGADVPSAGGAVPAAAQCSAASVASTAANSSGRTSTPFS
ncbi:membrane protein YczE [Actinomadura algeriensis]|uniref:Membrane protein YczE n=1 Tax=Actinomadura algeriensis TaxID=1679523 RepID=A0ABR9K002_9ACTN|nr:putative membrane protein YczE [Actinomadura algeriensis]